MIVEVSNNLRIFEAPPHALQWIREQNTFINPEWQNAIDRGSYAGKIPKYIKFYDDKDHTDGCAITCSRGNLRPLYDTFKQYGVKIVNKRVCPEIYKEIKLNDSFKIRDYQQEAVDIAINKTQGIVVSPAGSGKTVIGVSIAVRTKTPVLWITHKIELLDQTKERFLQCTELTADEIGIIGNGKCDLKNITIATVQSIKNLSEEILDKIKFTYGCVIVDEVHHVAAESWRIVEQFPAKFRIGLTATCYRADTLSDAIHRIIGLDIYNVDRNRLISDGSIMKSTLKYVMTNNEYPDGIEYPTLEDQKEKRNGEVNDTKLKHLVVADIARNNLVVKLTKKAVAENNCAVVLVDMIMHAEYLRDCIKASFNGENIPVYALYTKSQFQMKDFDRSLEKFVIVATFGKAEEGLDIPQLGALVMAYPCKSNKRIEQSIGRIERNTPNKGTPCIYDIFDDDHGPLRGKYKSRYALYSERDLQMEDITKEIIGGKENVSM